MANKQKEEAPLTESNNSNDESELIIQKKQTSKSATFVSYETMGLVENGEENILVPCGFRKDGKPRKIKNSCLISRIKHLCHLKDERPKLAVCITMYNEDVKEFKDTLEGVLQNYNSMYMDETLQLRRSDLIVVCVCDGFEQLKPEFIEYATKLQFFDIDILKNNDFMEQNREGKWVMKTMENLMDKTVLTEEIPKNIVHLFQVCTGEFDMIKEKNYLQGRRINFIFALKQRNDGKINSHKWFFQGICKYLMPQYCLMLDIGTKPQDDSIRKLYKYMRQKQNKNCGGCCGEIEVDLKNNKSCFSYLLKAAQFYEYKLSHTPDKACESFFGFNSVLPGAYCMFNWEAIKGGPMDAFFKLVNRKEPPSCSEANEYLAEDRVMCMQIYIKEECGYYLTYIPDAKAVTDAPDSLLVLMKQRRRWMNGSFFAAWRVINQSMYMMSCGNKSQHPCYRRVGMFIFMCYYFTNQVLQFFLVGSFYLSIKMFFQNYFKSVTSYSPLFENNEQLHEYILNGGLSQIFSLFYLGLLTFIFVISLGGVIGKGIFQFKVVGCIFSFLTISSLLGIIFFLYETGFYPEELKWDPDQKQWLHQQQYFFSILTVCGCIMLSVYFIPIILRPIDFIQNFSGYIIGMLIYILMLPTFINIMQIYSMSNLHDVSWGNRPTEKTGTNLVAANKKQEEELKDQYMMFRVNFLTFWIISNAIYVYVIDYFVGENKQYVNDGSIGFMEIFTAYLAGLVIYRVFFAVIHILKFKCRRNCLGGEYKVREINIKKHHQQTRGIDLDQCDFNEEQLIQQKSPNVNFSNQVGLKKAVKFSENSSERKKIIENEQDIEDLQDDELLQSQQPYLLAMRAANNKRKKSEFKKAYLEKRGLLDKNKSLDEDDDDIGFLEADEEEDQNNQQAQNTFLLSTHCAHITQKFQTVNIMQLNRNDNAGGGILIQRGVSQVIRKPLFNQNQQQLENRSKNHQGEENKDQMRRGTQMRFSRNQENHDNEDPNSSIIEF